MNTEHNELDAKKIKAEISNLPFMNLALQQNNIAVVYELKLKNEGTECIENIACKISAVPDILVSEIIPVERLNPGEEIVLRDLQIALNYPLLSSLSEVLKGTLNLDVFCEDTPLLHIEKPIEAYAADQWLGLNVIPELIASFVTPNLEVVNHLLSVVSDELEKATGSSSIQGYQADKTRVYEICAAIYRALHSWGIHYSNPASSFGTPGQRIRFADSIYKYRLGTCLDTTLLFASVMEQCGLHPVIMLQSGHAYIGCHLLDRYFSSPQMDDLQAIRKLADLDEFLVLETTMLAKNATFSEAEAVARSNHLNVDESFYCAIDIVRARYSGILPLPIKRSTDGIEFAPPERKVATLGDEQKRNLQKDVDLSQLDASPKNAGRIAHWTQKLLDLSLRNRLLNTRDNKQIIPIACSDIAVLEDKIAANEPISLNPLSNLLNEKDLHDLGMLRTSEVKTDIKLLLDSELQQQRIWTLLPPKEMLHRLTELYRQGKVDYEEGGVNTIFLAIGFLEWKTSARDPKSYQAPILLIPVRLQRKSLVEGIRIARIDEETMINETLLELLRSQFQLTIPGLSPLPTDDSGVNVPLVMQIFRQKIKEMKGWEVREEARLGRFSFGKFIMWTDMTSRVEELKENPLVRHLDSGGGLFDDGIDVFPQDEIGRHLNLSNLFCPLSADSSQLCAVLYSQMGKNFVLHGPPGTGKSQTITNIIAQNLALGRRVLFVSEKKAALEVVYKRLTAIGLGPFCLELHSNKSGKNEVLAQFSEALKVPETFPPTEWNTILDLMQKNRESLNDYVLALHYTYPNGLSAYDCFSMLLQKEVDFPDRLVSVDCLSQTQSSFDDLKQCVSELANAFVQTTPESLTALACIAVHEWSPSLEKDILSAVKDFQAAIPVLGSAYRACTDAMRLPSMSDLEMKHIQSFVQWIEGVQSAGALPSNLFSENFQDDAKFLYDFLEIAERLPEKTQPLLNYNLEFIKRMNPDDIELQIRQLEQSFWLVRFFKTGPLINANCAIKKLGSGKLTLPELIAILPAVRELQNVMAQYDATLPRAKALLGDFWTGKDTDFSAVRKYIASVQFLLKLLSILSEGLPGAYETGVAFLKKYFASSDSNPLTKSLSALINEMLSAWRAFEIAQKRVSEYVPTFSEVNQLSEMAQPLHDIVSNISNLRDAICYREIRLKATQFGVSKWVQYMESNPLPHADVAQMFNQIYASEMLAQILEKNPALSHFSGLNHEQKIQRFCELDDVYTRLSQKIIFAKLVATLPKRRSGQCPEGSELGLLKRECEKRSRQKPVRQLLSEIKSLVHILKPCFLMSPLSVAQYLPPNSEPFDLIVFDEASQIPVWDAIGVIARGKQVIVVGDPKQMPPTNFFQKGDADDDAPTLDIKDLESILDECLAAGVHPTYLNWHYRSRHESLISFSNHHYYENKLFTFPAAHTSSQFGVRFQFVPNGVYDRKASRTNAKEAEALVAYVFKQLRDPAQRKRSIGIVTFSEAQKNLIEDLIDRKRDECEELDTFLSEQKEEPIFVKNLENVQGDERDVILFSICYAPAEDGKFSMNFGPLNRQGGERRLNVAITRAKEQVVVFASIHATQIELSRTHAVGAAHLKYFLDYAEKGIRDVPVASTSIFGEGLLHTIQDFLEAEGFIVQSHIGCSAYRIDLGVRNPDYPDEFLLGIECDGPSYAAQKTARDRDHLRESVLRSLGWTMYRAWSVDWALDRKRSEKKLLDKINALREIRKQPKAEIPTPSAPVPPIETPPPSASETLLTPPTPIIPEHQKNYEVCILPPQSPQEFFYEPTSLCIIQDQLNRVIQLESPIYETLLRKRVARAWGINRVGDTIVNILNAAMPADACVSQFDGCPRVIWKTQDYFNTFADYRVPADDLSKRAIDEIPPEELANGLYQILTDFNACKEDTLYRETLKLFGLTTVTPKARKFLELGMQVLKNKGLI